LLLWVFVSTALTPVVVTESGRSEETSRHVGAEFGESVAVADAGARTFRSWSRRTPAARREANSRSDSFEFKRVMLTMG
jgi:hypothetical protein